MSNARPRAYSIGITVVRDREPWVDRAACRYEPGQPDLWFTGRMDVDRVAAHVCVRHCPVLAQCRAAAYAQQPQHGVMGGVLWAGIRNLDVGRVAAYQPKRIPCGAHCDRWRDAA